MDWLVIVAIILETIVLNKICLVLLVTAFKVDFQKNLEKKCCFVTTLIYVTFEHTLENKSCSEHSNIYGSQRLPDFQTFF